MKNVTKKEINEVEVETVQKVNSLLNFLHIFFAAIIIGLFSYWCYLINDIYQKTEASDIEAVTLDIAKSETIFHAIVLVFFLYFIFLARDNLKFMA